MEIMIVSKIIKKERIQQEAEKTETFMICNKAFRCDSDKGVYSDDDREEKLFV